MLLNDWLRLIAGTFVLISGILGLLYSKYWFIFCDLCGLKLDSISVYQMVPDDYFFEKAGSKGVIKT